MSYNWIYDEINMNTFNFVNATFNDMFYRYPTTQEFDNAYNVIELNEPAQIFGEVAQSKLEYLGVLTNTEEFYEGLIRWSYLSMLAREPSANEVYNQLQGFVLTNEVLTVQREIFKSDEHAGFD